MSTKIVCDNCGREALGATMDLSPHYHLEAQGLQPSHFPREYDFCSWRCLSEFAANRMDKQMGPLKPRIRERSDA